MSKTADPDPDFLKVFGVTAKAAAETILQYLADKRSLESKEDQNAQVLQSLLEVADICEAFKENASATEQIAMYMATAEENILDAFYALLTIFPAFMREGVHRELVRSLLLVHRMLYGWTCASKVFSTAVVERGLMVQHMEELPLLQKASGYVEIVNIFADVNLRILYNCACATSIKGYFVYPSFDCVKILVPFTQSSQFAIRIHAVFVLCHLSTLFASQHTHLVQLSHGDIDKLLSAFEYASTTGDHKVCFPDPGREMTISEMTDVLETLQANEMNCVRMIERNIVPTLASLLAAKGFEERLSGCRLLWSLLQHSAFKEQVHSSDFPIAEIVQMLKEDPHEDLCQVALCTLFSLEGVEEEDISSHLEVARGCYRYGYYSECSELCKNIINEKTATQPEKNQAMLLLGKASFHLYRQMQFELEKEKRLQRHYTAPYRAKHKQCYEKAKVAIGKLGAAMDGNFLEKKEEELRMLDMAMIDYLQETNKLERCLLCRKHTKAPEKSLLP